MVKEKMKKSAVCLIGSLILAGTIAVIGDISAAWQGIDVKCSLFLLAAAALTAFFCFLFRKTPKNAVKVAATVVTVLGLLVGALFVSWYLFSGEAAFAGLDDGKKQLYANQKVLLLTPHQDDDINVLGGVMEEYVRYGSVLYPVFVTNGDAEGLAEERFRETLQVFSHIGVPEENVIFLGYGDTWKEGEPHIYNAAPGQIVESLYGRTETYGTQAKGVWREGAAYTVDNFMEDMENVILTLRPDVIYCSDYDLHIDHRAVTLMFEKVMGKILQENPDYRPRVFKAYAYATAWYAEPDFYEINLLSTQNVFEEPHNQTPEIYRWEDRLQLPVGDYTLSRSLFTSEIYRTLALYASQEAHFQAARIINADKVVWYRDTGSLCYDAQITVSSGNGSLLNDFMLIENRNLTDTNHMPYDGVWTPSDTEKKAEIVLSQPETVGMVRLYDHPSPEDNVLKGVLRFEDGSEVTFGPLDPGGAATEIAVAKEQVTSFEVVLTKTEGNNPGLSEIEVYRENPNHGMRYVKFTDRDGNFVYDWLMDGSEGYLELYVQGLTEEEKQNLTLSWNNTDSWAEFENGRIRIICPEGKSMVLTVSVEGTDLSDTVKIRNTGKLTRGYYSLCQLLEEQVFQKYCDGAHRKSASYKLLMTALSIIK